MVEKPSVAVQHGNQLLVGNVDSRVDAVKHAVRLRPIHASVRYHGVLFAVSSPA